MLRRVGLASFSAFSQWTHWYKKNVDCFCCHSIEGAAIIEKTILQTLVNYLKIVNKVEYGSPFCNYLSGA